MTEYDFEFGEDDECKTRYELLNSDGFQCFLYLYNREMSKRNPRHEYLTPADAEYNYNDARRLFEYWKKLQMTGNVMVISNIQKLIKSSMEDVRIRDTGRVLSQDEVVERCDRKCIDIENSVKESEKFYLEIGYEQALREKGVLAKGQKYELGIPAFTEARMQNFEYVFDRDFGSVVMVNDDRLNTGELVELLFPNPQRKIGKGYDLIRESVSFSKAEMEDLARDFARYGKARDPAKIVEYCLAKAKKSRPVSVDLREPGLMLFSPFEAPAILPPMESAPGESFLQAVSAGKMPMDLAAYLKSMAFIKKTTPGRAKKMIGNDEGTAIYSIHTVLNNVLPSGETLVVEGLPGAFLSVTKANPAKAAPGSVCRPCYYI